ncbi:MAG: biopolymer transporter ExbD [Candidatus Cloacimonadaceae bacterium]|jgi:biopolymer transport protein ExbD|nr:biopolymer transporter ExbD [Candidatus Cloacimonadota bacterium]MDY0126549.1 biopolymer transporter ExbD [Candidatus Cloacimonadaceae bacterium]MCB5254643.1 biopolymer transporter ExbD [Candidatus Cloacimonadota bacterium]MCK9177730.1 biopolymer transporter ExbD [Candidatus Cloacimonadota bacterium]MCK9241904.1 biopolymer transporter ExbD [Candidatus Cloacimonadota bacterium]
MKLRLSKKKISSTMLISMTDVIFLLIIFLLIVSNFSSQSGLPIRLPGSKSAALHSLQSIHISYLGDDQLFYNGELVDFPTLAELLTADYIDPEQVVRFSAMEDTPLQKVISVMDIIRGAGFEKIFVATEVVKEELQ